MKRAFRENGVATLALAGLIVIAAVVGGYILANQRLNPPAWVPVIGQERFMLKVQFQNAQGVLPGQGQAVNVSGVKVGEIASTDLEGGKAVVSLRIQPRFARVYPDATALLRPKTGLKDMVLELDPGSPRSGRRLADGATIDDGSTQPDANLDEFFATLDADTRDYLKLLINDAGRGLGTGGGRDLARTVRRFDPLARDFRRAGGLVAKRRVQLRRAMTSLSLLTGELGRYDRQVARFVNGSAGTFRRFAAQNENLATSVSLLPPALDSTNRALSKIDTLGSSARTTLGGLRPAARSLGPSLRALQPFLRDTTPVLRDQLRPFSRAAQPTTRDLVPVARELSASTPDLRRFTDVLNALGDELAYDPPGNGVGGQSYGFFAPWAAHNTNSALSAQDGIQPVRRGLVYFNCGSLQLLNQLAEPKRNPTLSTVIQMLNTPKPADCRGGR